MCQTPRRHWATRRSKTRFCLLGASTEWEAQLSTIHSFTPTNGNLICAPCLQVWVYRSVCNAQTDVRGLGVFPEEECRLGWQLMSHEELSYWRRMSCGQEGRALSTCSKEGAGCGALDRAHRRMCSWVGGTRSGASLPRACGHGPPPSVSEVHCLCIKMESV